MAVEAAWPSVLVVTALDLTSGSLGFKPSCKLGFLKYVTFFHTGALSHALRKARKPLDIVRYSTSGIHERFQVFITVFKVSRQKLAPARVFSFSRVLALGARLHVCKQQIQNWKESAELFTFIWIF